MTILNFLLLLLNPFVLILLGCVIGIIIHYYNYQRQKTQKERALIKLESIFLCALAIFGFLVILYTSYLPENLSQKDYRFEIWGAADSGELRLNFDYVNKNYVLELERRDERWPYVRIVLIGFDLNEIQKIDINEANIVTDKNICQQDKNYHTIICDYNQSESIQWIAIKFLPKSIINGKIDLVSNMKTTRWTVKVKLPKDIACRENMCITEKQKAIKESGVNLLDFSSSYDPIENIILVQPTSENDYKLNHSFKLNLFNEYNFKLKGIIFALLIAIFATLVTTAIEIFKKDAWRGIIYTGYLVIFGSIFIYLPLL